MTTTRAAKWALPIGLAVSVAFLGACGGTTETADQPAAAETVGITEFVYSPKEITVNVGDTVEWINRDAFLHTVTSGAVDGPENKPDDKFDEDLVEADSKASVTFDEAGTFTYFCKQHNAMDGVVIVR